MAGGMNLATKYSRIVDERWHETSQAALVLSNDNYSFKGDKTVVVYSIPISPLVNYSRSGTSRYGTPDDLSRNIQTLTVAQDKGFTFIIDKGDEIQSEYVSNPGSALAREIREVIVPNFDTYCFRTMAAAARDYGNYASTAITNSNAFEMLMDGVAFFGNHNVPIENVYCFATYKYAGLLMRDNAFIRYSDRSQEMLMKGVIGKAGGVEIVLVPDTKLPAGASFLLVHKDACIAPRQLEEYKIHDNPPGISGSLVEGRVLYDCFVLDEKINGVYYHGGQAQVFDLRAMTAASASGKSKVLINEDKNASTNLWYCITAATKAALPTVTYGTAIDLAQGGAWYGATLLSNAATEITPTSGHKYVAITEVNSSYKPQKYVTLKLNVG